MTTNTGLRAPLVEKPNQVSKPLRMLGLLLAAYIAGVHVALAEARYLEDTRYVGALFVAGAMGLVIGAAIAAGGRRFGMPVVWAAWVMDLVIVVGMFVGFVLSRTVGLPGYHRHDWPPVQIVALVFEVLYVLVFVLARRERVRS